MKKFFFNNRINFLFLIISFVCLIGVLGIENILFHSTKWLYGLNDASMFLSGWNFLKMIYGSGGGEFELPTPGL